MLGIISWFLFFLLCPVHEVSANVLLLPVQLSLLPVNLCIVLLSTEYFYEVPHLISWINLIHSISQPNVLTSGHPRGSSPGNP